jgi:hypothetical protein
MTDAFMQQSQSASGPEFSKYLLHGMQVSGG